MIVWEEIVNRYVMSIFGKEALSVFEKGTPVSHILEGKSLACSLHRYYPHLIHPPAFNISGLGRAKGPEGNRNHHLSFQFSQREITDASKECKDGRGKKGGGKNIRTYGRPALGVFFHISCIIDRSMFKEKKRNKKAKRRRERRRMKTKNT